MSRRAACALAISCAGLVAALAATPAVSQPAGASALLARARQALGGEPRLASIRSFVVTGSIERGYRSRSTYGAFEIACRLPDRFVARESMTSVRLPEAGRVEEERTTATLGFNGPVVLYEPAGTFAHRRSAPERPGAAEVDRLLPRARLDFVRLTLGMFATSFAGAPVTFADGTRPGAVRVIVNGDTVELEFDDATGLPSRFGSLEYRDYRDVNGVKVPFRMVVADGSSFVNAWTIDHVRFDVELPDARFRRK